MSSHQPKPSIANAASLFGQDDENQQEDPFSTISDNQVQEPVHDQVTQEQLHQHPSSLQVDSQSATAPTSQSHPSLQPPPSATSIESAIPSPTALFGEANDGNDDWLVGEGGARGANTAQTEIGGGIEQQQQQQVGFDHQSQSTTNPTWDQHQQQQYDYSTDPSAYDYSSSGVVGVGYDQNQAAVVGQEGYHPNETGAYDQQQQQYDHGYYDESGNWIYYDTTQGGVGYDQSHQGQYDYQPQEGYHQGYENQQYASDSSQQQYDPSQQNYDSNYQYDPNSQGQYDVNQTNYDPTNQQADYPSQYDASQSNQYDPSTQHGNYYDPSQQQYDSSIAPPPQQQVQEQSYDPYAPIPTSQIENHQYSTSQPQSTSNDTYYPNNTFQDTSNGASIPPPPRNQSPYDPQPSNPNLSSNPISTATPPPPTSSSPASASAVGPPPKGPPRGPSSKKSSLGVYEIPKEMVGTPTPESGNKEILALEPQSLEEENRVPEGEGEGKLPWEIEDGGDAQVEGNQEDGDGDQGWIQGLEAKVSSDNDRDEEEIGQKDSLKPEIRIQDEEESSKVNDGKEENESLGLEKEEVIQEIQESDENTPTPEEDSKIPVEKELESLNLNDDEKLSTDQESQAPIPKAPSPFNENQTSEMTLQDPEIGFNAQEGGEAEMPSSTVETEGQGSILDPENAGGEYGAYQNQGNDYGYGYGSYDYSNQNQEETGDVEGGNYQPQAGVEGSYEPQSQGVENGYEGAGMEYGAYQDQGGYGSYENNQENNDSTNEGYDYSNDPNSNPYGPDPSNDPNSNHYAPSSDDVNSNPYGPTSTSTSTSTYDPYAPAPTHSLSSSSTDTEHASQPFSQQTSETVYDPYNPSGYSSENQDRSAPTTSLNEDGLYQDGGEIGFSNGYQQTPDGYGGFNSTNYETANEVYNPYEAENQDASQLNAHVPSNLPSTPLNQQGPYSNQFPSDPNASQSSPYDPSTTNYRQPPHSANSFGSNYNQQRDQNSNDNYGMVPKSAPASGGYDYGPSSNNTPGTANGSENGGSYFTQQQQSGFNQGAPPPVSPYAPSNVSNYGPTSDYGGAGMNSSLPSHSRSASAIGGNGHHDVLEEKRTARIPLINFGLDGKLLTYFPSFDSSSNLEGNSGMGMMMATNSRSEFPTKVSIRSLKNVIPTNCYSSVFEPDCLNGPLFEGSTSSATSAFSKATGSGTGTISTLNKNKKTHLIKVLKEKAEEMKKGLGYLRRRGSNALVVGGGGNLSSNGIVNQDEESERKVRKEEDKILLLRLLAVILENDGNIVNNVKFDSEVRDLLIENSSDLNPSTAPNFISPFNNSNLNQKNEVVKTYELKTSFLDEITSLLLKGSRREAVSLAVENKMWSHALTIASSVDKECWRDVVSKFSHYEVLGTNEDGSSGVVSEERLGLKVVYDLISGQQPSEVYSLFRPKPSSTSAPGLPSTSNLSTHALLASGDSTSTITSPSSPSDVQPKWRQAAAMVVANRSAGDSASLTAIGDGLLAGDWHEAAHICYLLSPLTSSFGGIDTPNVRLTLLGSKSPRASSEYLRDLDYLSMTEIYEFSHCLTPVVKGQEAFNGIPHLQAYRLAHAYLLAEMGDTQKAQKYCEAIAATLKTGKPSPYFHRTLVSQLKLLSERLTGAPHHSEGSSSWMTRKMQRPTLDGMWGALEGRFTKFIAGEDSDGVSGPKTATPNNKASSNGKSDAIGPFSHYSSITPEATSGSVSRVQSYADFNNHAGTGFSGMNSPPIQPSSRAGSAMDFHQITRNSSPANNRATSAMGIRTNSSLRDPYSEWPQSNQHQQGPSSSSAFNPYGQPENSSRTDLINSERSSESGGAYDGPYKSQGPTHNAPWYNHNQQGGESTSSPQWGSSYEPTRMSQDSQPPQHSNEPYYGYQSHGAEEQQFASNIDDDGQVGGNFSSPMDAFAATTPQPSYVNSYSNNDSRGRVEDEEDDEDDLGFGNSSSSKNKGKQKANDQNQGDDSSSSKKAQEEEEEKRKKEEAEKKKPELKSSSSTGSWLGRFWGKKEGMSDEGSKAKKAHLGEETSFYYDKETKRWVNKKAGGDTSAAPSPPPPPPRAQTTSPSMQGRPGMGGLGTPPPPPSSSGGPPPSGLRRGSSEGLAPPRGTPPISESNDEGGAAAWGGPPPRARSNLAEEGQMAAVQPPNLRSASSSLPPSGANSVTGTPPPPPSSRGGTVGKKKPIKNRYVVVD